MFPLYLCKQTSQRHGSTPNGDHLSRDYTKQRSQVFLFCCLEALHPKTASWFFLYEIKCPVYYFFPLFRKQNNSWLSKLSPKETENQLTTVNIFLCVSSLRPCCKPFDCFSSLSLHKHAERQSPFCLYFVVEEKEGIWLCGYLSAQ